MIFLLFIFPLFLPILFKWVTFSTKSIIYCSTRNDIPKWYLTHFLYADFVQLTRILNYSPVFLLNQSQSLIYRKRHTTAVKSLDVVTPLPYDISKRWPIGSRLIKIVFLWRIWASQIQIFKFNFYFKNGIYFRWYYWSCCKVAYKEKEKLN